MRHYKIIVLILSVFALIVSCTNDVEDVFTKDVSIVTPKASSSIRSYSEALEIAQNAISILDKNGQQTRSGSSRSVDFKEQAITICAGNKISTRSSGSNGNDTLMYVFNYTDNNGFAVVSADKGTEGLIAVIESGHYDPSDTTDTGFRRYMTAAKYYILANQAIKETEPNRAPKGFYFEFDTIGVVNISPRITVKWGQYCHEAQYCPYHISGCSNTAAAMIMSYFEYPSVLEITYNQRNYYMTLNWSGMKSYINRFDNNPVSTSNIHDIDTCINVDHKKVGYLCRELAYRSCSYFFPEYTSGNIEFMRDALISLDYIVDNVTSYQYLVNTNTIANHLSNGKLIYMGGETVYGIGHAWVIDGYHGYTVHSQYYEYDIMNGIPGPAILMDEQFITYRYNHINWGLDGINNGYFADGVFSYYGDAYSYDGSGTYVDSTSNDNTITLNNFGYNLEFMTVYKD